MHKELLCIEGWQEKEATRDAVWQHIHDDFRYSDETSFPAESYSEAEVEEKSTLVYVHVFRRYHDTNNVLDAEAA